MCHLLDHDLSEVPIEFATKRGYSVTTAAKEFVREVQEKLCHITVDVDAGRILLAKVEREGTRTDSQVEASSLSAAEGFVARKWCSSQAVVDFDIRNNVCCLNDTFDHPKDAT